LARAATHISVADVIQAIDGPVTVTACSTDEGQQCEQYSKCNVRDPLWRVRERILTALGECTIAELASDPPPPAAAKPAVCHTHLCRPPFPSTWITPGGRGGRGAWWRRCCRPSRTRPATPRAAIIPLGGPPRKRSKRRASRSLN